jgi:hypothetical protein
MYMYVCTRWTANGTNKRSAVHRYNEEVEFDPELPGSEVTYVWTQLQGGFGKSESSEIEDIDEAAGPSPRTYCIDAFRLVGLGSSRGRG